MSTRSSPLAFIIPNSFCGVSCLQPAPVTRARQRMVKLNTFIQVIRVVFLLDRAFTLVFTHSLLCRRLLRKNRAKFVPSPNYMVLALPPTASFYLVFASKHKAYGKVNLSVNTSFILVKTTSTTSLRFFVEPLQITKKTY